MPPADFPRLEGWMTATEVAARLHLSRQQVNKMINSGFFSSVHTLGSLYLVKTAEVEEKLQKRIEDAVSLGE
jgi:excisionase family DNA binding protein